MMKFESIKYGDIIHIIDFQETRDVDVATEERFMKDKEMQFTYGDDTQLFNIIRYIIL